MPSLSRFDKIDQSFSKVEKSLNFIGHFPLVSLASGFVRVGFGFFELGFGLVIFSVHLCICCLNNKKYNAVKGLVYMLHGLLNLLRGVLEILCFNFIFLIIYDHFKVRVSYAGEKKASTEKPNLVENEESNASILLSFQNKKNIIASKLCNELDNEFYDVDVEDIKNRILFYTLNEKHSSLSVDSSDEDLTKAIKEDMIEQLRIGHHILLPKTDAVTNYLKSLETKFAKISSEVIRQSVRTNLRMEFSRKSYPTDEEIKECVENDQFQNKVIMALTLQQTTKD